MSTQEITTPQREKIRNEHRLRPLSRDEEGTGARRLPPGVYGFTYAPVTESPLFSKHDYHSFEVHLLADGSEHLIGLLTPAEAERFRAGNEIFEVLIYPDPWEAATEMVSLPFERLRTNRRTPSREAGNWLKAMVVAVD